MDGAATSFKTLGIFAPAKGLAEIHFLETQNAKNEPNERLECAGELMLARYFSATSCEYSAMFLTPSRV